MSSPGSGGSRFDFLARFAGPIAWLIAGLLLLFGGVCLGCHWSFTMCGGIFCVSRWARVDVDVGKGFLFVKNDIESFSTEKSDLTLNFYCSFRNRSDLRTWQTIEGVVTQGGKSSVNPRNSMGFPSDAEGGGITPRNLSKSDDERSNPINASRNTESGLG